MNNGVDIGKIENLSGNKDINWFERIIKFCRVYTGNFLIVLIKNTIDSNVFNGLIDWVKYLIKFLFNCKFNFLFKKDNSIDICKVYESLKRCEEPHKFEFVKSFMNNGVDIGKIEKLRGKKNINWFERIIKFCRVYTGNFLILLIKNTIDSNVFNGLIDWVKYLNKFLFNCKFMFFIQKG
jgi:hypothetical protein